MKENLDQTKTILVSEEIKFGDKEQCKCILEWEGLFCSVLH